NALEILALVYAGKPVPYMIGFCMTAQANTVRFLGGTISEADDFVFRVARIPTRRHVQTARAVALFAGYVLYRVTASAIALGEVSVARGALIRPCCLRPRDFHELTEVLGHLVRLSLGLVLCAERRSEQKGKSKQKGEEQTTWPHGDLRLLRLVGQLQSLM